MIGFNSEKQKKGRQMRITESEIELIKKTFKDNEQLLKLLRKIFLPELDPTAPLGENIDLWLSVPVKQLPHEDAVIQIMARNELINHIEMQLMVLDNLANTEAKSLAEIQENMRKDSAK